jgi:hypothetical protein
MVSATPNKPPVPGDSTPVTPAAAPPSSSVLPPNPAADSSTADTPPYVPNLPGDGDAPQISDLPEMPPALNANPHDSKTDAAARMNLWSQEESANSSYLINYLNNASDSARSIDPAKV